MKAKKYWHTVTTLVWDSNRMADVEKYFTFTDSKEHLSDQQLQNRIEKHYGVRPDLDRIAGDYAYACSGS